MTNTNQVVWETHYKRDRARQAYPDENVVRLLKRAFSLETPGSRALDLGSGSGRHLPLLAEHFSEVVACDFSHTSLKMSDSTLKRSQAALPELPFVDAAFDFVLCWGVLHYLDAALLEPAIASLERILKKGGHVFLTLRADSDTHLAAQLHAGDLKEGHARLFSKKEALELFARFKTTQYGFIARQPLGEEGFVAHHLLFCEK